MGGERDALHVLGDENAVVDLAAIKADALRLANETDSAGRVWDGTPPDDFEILEGIGQIYERRLYSAGICSYESLAAATPAASIPTSTSTSSSSAST